jgi:thioredoxin-dependent peroxiredoxin
VLGVSTDTPAENLAFREKFGFPYDFLSDVDGGVSRDYGAMGEGAGRASRVSVLIDPDGRVAACWPQVTPANHAEEVLAALAAED